MLKSLFSGVSGLQAHQVAMDIEGNNIANVNTTGFKYSRANFSDLLSQTSQIATAPEGSLGGKNAMQTGLGSTVASSTRIFSQGSIQNTDKNTDIAIQGDGFYVLSDDNGKSLKYTRSGDFKFDAAGNFVDNAGNIVQGWLRDENTLNIDNTLPIQSISIPPGLTTPANPTGNVTIKANLNAGDTVTSFSSIHPLDQFHNYYDLNQDGVGIDNPRDTALDGMVDTPIALDPLADARFNDDDLTGDDLYYVADVNSENNATRLVINSDDKVVEKGEDFGVLFNANGEAFNLQSGQGVVISFSGDIYDTSTGALTGLGKEFRYTDVASNVDTAAGSSPVYFKTTEDLRQALQNYARVESGNANVNVTVTSDGKFQVDNLSDGNGATQLDLFTDVQPITGDLDTTDNLLFTQSMQSLAGTLTEGSAGVKVTQPFNAATHGTSVDVYDSLGSKHTLHIEYRKIEQNPTTGSTWEMIVTVPEPGVINLDGDNYPSNKLVGQISFDNHGALSSNSISSLVYTANNGSEPNQAISLDFGTPNDFDGMTSFDIPSSTTGINQDGYAGGDLIGKRIDQSGTIIGSFSNGRSFGLAQVSMAKFTNNEGLSVDGGNIFRQTANSGDPTIGVAATGGRGFIQSSALEASNVDLSKSLTQLIIVQRGFQANSKTITTSDTLLETLIGLKR